MLVGRSEDDIASMGLRGAVSTPIDGLDELGALDDSAPRWDIPDDVTAADVRLETAHASPAPNLPFARQRLGWEDEEENLDENRARLPEGWTEYLDETTGRCFYHNEAAKRTQWEWPEGPLPPLEGKAGQLEGLSPSDSVLIAAGEMAQSPFNNVGDLSGFLERDFEPEVSPVEEARHGPVTSPGPLDGYDPPPKHPEPGWCAYVLFHILSFFAVWFGHALFDRDQDGDFDVNDAQMFVVDCLNMHAPRHLRAKLPRPKRRFLDLLRETQAKRTGLFATNLEGAIRSGVVLQAKEEAVVFASVVTWDRMCNVNAGNQLTALGPPIEGEGYIMVPVKTPVGDGAISLASVSLLRMPPPPPPLPPGGGPRTGSKNRDSKTPLGGPSPSSSTSAGTLHSKLEAKARIWRTKFECHPGQNTFKEFDQLTCVADDLDICKGLCLEKGYGAFVVWRKYAYFKSQSTIDCRNNLVFDREATTYLNLEKDPYSPVGSNFNESDEASSLVDNLLEYASRGEPDMIRSYVTGLMKKSTDLPKVALALSDPRLQGVLKMDRNGDGDVDLFDLLETSVVGESQEEETMHTISSGKFFPWFVFFQCFVPGAAWLVEAVRHEMDLMTGKAGLDSLFPGRTDLRLYFDCEDYRWQIWRWWSYQFTHVGMTHIGMNVLLTFFLGMAVEAGQGHLVALAIFQLGVFGGAACSFMTATRVAVVGMSGGVYALVGGVFANLLINWNHRKYRIPQMLFMIGMGVADYLAYRYGTSPEYTSHAAHIGGGVVGVFAGVLVGRSKDKRRWERYLQVVVGLLTIAALIAFMAIGLQWPPRDWLDGTPWCWSRQVWNRTHFNSSEWQCVRCGDEDCMKAWTTQQNWVADVDTYFCMQIGWSPIPPILSR
eukprot:TRINITY_DN29051_c0_g1_i1.p1 TRINITY_DN29051_c0_g1~~TRINITY_DN29051_c0_g1_i1.p1  ORF type:complete len:884 (+),score=178.54 TRINITY_DN29051_c0_g1_i1:180-2831(+)